MRPFELPLSPQPQPVRRTAKFAQTLALARHMQDAVHRLIVADRAVVASKMGLTWAQVTQLLD